MIHSQKFVNKYMRLVHFVAQDNDICQSRKVAALIVDANHKIQGVGYNGPPTGTPHCNDPLYMRNVVKPMLTPDEKESLRLAFGDVDKALESCEGCPRKFMRYKSGVRPEMCSCQHAESNAIVNAACDVSGSVMYCTLMPCVNCVGMIMNSRIAEIHFPAEEVYQPQVDFLLRRSRVEFYQWNPDTE